MFTGIISDVGQVVEMSRRGDIARLVLDCGYEASGLALGASVANAGACLTVVAQSARNAGARLAFDVGAETLAVTTLGERWNTRIIVSPDRAPVTSGPYRFMRHPNYLAVVIEIAAVPMIGGAIFTAIAFSIGNALILAVRIPAEERAMGGRYADALGSRRRFFPGLRQS